MRYETDRTRRRGHPDSGTDALARGLGVFSLALGAAEVIAPGALARALGLEGHETLIRGYGLREIATGVGILASDDPTPWIWGRVAGDALDLATLATGFEEGDHEQRRNLIVALAAVTGVTALDVYCGQALSRESTVPLPPIRDYSDRTGFPRGLHGARGAARDFETPRDMRAPPAMQPFTRQQQGAGSVP
jgi:hypothetical protein